MSENLELTEVIHSEIGNCVIFILVGELEARSVSELENEVHKNIASGILFVMLDLTALRFLSSSGIGILIRLLDYIESNRGRLLLIGLSDRIQNTLELAGIADVFLIFNSNEDASQWLKKQTL